MCSSDLFGAGFGFCATGFGAGFGFGAGTTGTGFGFGAGEVKPNENPGFGAADTDVLGATDLGLKTFFGAALAFGSAFDGATTLGGGVAVALGFAKMGAAGAFATTALGFGGGGGGEAGSDASILGLFATGLAFGGAKTETFAAGFGAATLGFSAALDSKGFEKGKAGAGGRHRPSGARRAALDCAEGERAESFCGPERPARAIR